MTTATLEPRMTNPVFVIPDALDHLLALAKAVRKAGLPETTGYLVDLRASQINGCSFCVEMHAK